MDNFAVTLAAGGARRGKERPPVLQVSLLFALAHFVMFSGGWLLGTGIGHWVHAFDHWVAFAILAFIGGRMVQEAFSHEEDVARFTSIHSFKTRLLLAVATSVDAWMVGMGLSFTHAPFWFTAQVMVLFVFITSYGGFWLGAWLGKKLGPVMEGIGGVLLMLIGVKLLLEGLGIW